MNGTKPIKKVWNYPKRKKYRKTRRRKNSERNARGTSLIVSIIRLSIQFETFHLKYLFIHRFNKSTLQFWPFAIRTQIVFHSPKLLISCTRCELIVMENNAFYLDELTIKINFKIFMWITTSVVPCKFIKQTYLHQNLFTPMAHFSR